MQPFPRRFVELCVVDKYLHCLEQGVDWLVNQVSGAECDFCAAITIPTIPVGIEIDNRYEFYLCGSQKVCVDCMNIVRAEFNRQQLRTNRHFAYILMISIELTISDIGKQIALKLPRIPSINLTSNHQ